MCPYYDKTFPGDEGAVPRVYTAFSPRSKSLDFDIEKLEYRFYDEKFPVEENY